MAKGQMCSAQHDGQAPQNTEDDIKCLWRVHLFITAIGVRHAYKEFPLPSAEAAPCEHLGANGSLREAFQPAVPARVAAGCWSQACASLTALQVGLTAVS